MTRIKKCSLKLTAIILGICISITLVSPQAVEASWFSDLMGGLFTLITAPIQVFCPDNPTFRKNNPFRKKLWEEQAKEEQKERERERYRKTVARQEQQQTILEKLTQEIEDLKKQDPDPEHRLNLTQEQLEELLKEVLPKAVGEWATRHLEQLRGEQGLQGPKGDTGLQGPTGSDGEKGQNGRDGECDCGKFRPKITPPPGSIKC